jgi:AraC-like DNA-binding protein
MLFPASSASGHHADYDTLGSRAAFDDQPGIRQHKFETLSISVMPANTPPDRNCVLLDIDRENTRSFFLVPASRLAAWQKSARSVEKDSMLLRTGKTNHIVMISVCEAIISQIAPYYLYLFDHCKSGNEDLNDLIAAYAIHSVSQDFSTREDLHTEIEALLSTHLSQLIMLSLQSSMDSNIPARSLSAIKLHSRAVGYIKSNIEDPEITPSRVAQAAGISVSYLHKLFNATGRSVGRCIIEERLIICGKRLRDRSYKNIPISTIAYDAGFNNPAHFSSRFRRRFGVSPREYRAEVATPVLAR